VCCLRPAYTAPCLQHTLLLGAPRQRQEHIAHGVGMHATVVTALGALTPLALASAVVLPTGVPATPSLLVQTCSTWAYNQPCTL
jgi:hypothetical protein